MLDKLLKQALDENNLQLSADARAKCVRFLELLQKWNKTFNLTSITDPKEMVYLHIIDSLLVSPLVSGARCLDVGSGAGIPGIPLAIMHPEQQWVLLDKNNKKTLFQVQAIADLGLKNVQAVHSRAEDFHPEQGFDSILSRAYATLALFVKTSQHLICKKGTFVAMKGKHPHDEIADLVTSAVDVTDVTQLDMKGMQLERNVVRLKLKDSN